MPSTGLARDHGRAARLAWSTVLLAARVLPFASSPATSGRALAALMLDEPPPAPSGATVDHRLRPIPASVRARDEAFQDEVLRETRTLAHAVAA